VGDLVPEHIAVVSGLRVTTVPRAIVEYAASASVVRLGHVIDDATIRRRATTVAGIGAALAVSNRLGRRGVGRLRDALDDRGPGRPTPRSLLERRLDDVLGLAAIDGSVAERPIPSARGYVGFVDRAVEDAQLIIEADGRTWHSREVDMARDRARDREAAVHGWVTIRILDEELLSRPAEIAVELRAIVASRLEQLGRAA
jgi:hypothetical protein